MSVRLININIDLANVGVSTKVERASVNDVKERLAMLTRKRKNPEAETYGKLNFLVLELVVFTLLFRSGRKITSVEAKGGGR